MNEQTVEQLVKQIEELLQQYQVQSWAKYFEEMACKLASACQQDQDWRTRELLHDLKNLYGGMGSFQDYVIARSHGDKISRSDEGKANIRLNELRHQLASAIRSELDQSQN